MSKISLFVLMQLTNVADTHTDTQTPHDGIGRAYASHRATKTVSHSLTFLLVFHIDKTTDKRADRIISALSEDIRLVSQAFAKYCQEFLHTFQHNNSH